MKEKIASVPTKAGVMPVFVVHPEAGPCHLIIQYMDVWGVREELYDIARRIAAFGYVCAVPDLYYRWGEVRTEFRDSIGRMISFARLTPDQQAKTIEPLKKLSDAMVVDDTASLLSFFAAERPVHQGGVGTIGYCMGGRHVLRVASEFPDRIRASASLHGTALVSAKPDSAHLTTHKIRGEVYCGFAMTMTRRPPPSRRSSGGCRRRKRRIATRSMQARCTATRCRIATSTILGRHHAIGN